MTLLGELMELGRVVHNNDTHAAKLQSSEKYTLQIVSDLHLSHSNPIDYSSIIKPTGDILAILGDIIEFDNSHHDIHRIWIDLLFYCSCNFKFVIIILGNHDYCTNDNSLSMKKIEKEIYDMCMAFKNVCLLQNETVLVNNTLIVGSTLWSNVPEFCRDVVQNSMCEYYLSYSEPYVLNDVNHTNELHLKSVKYIESKLKGYNNYDNIIILTHHAPSLYNTSSPRHGNTLERKLNAAFASSLEYMFHHKLIWCNGHTHYNNKQTINNTILYSNQRGHGSRTYLPDFVLPYEL